MFPATGPRYVARFKQTDRGNTFFTERPVVAWMDWSDDGAIPVVSNDTGLVLANSYDNFHDIQPADPRTVAVLPAQGWLAEFKGEGEALFSVPLIGWAVTEDGDCKPLVGDSAGFHDDPTETTNFVRLYHPDYPPTEEAS